MARFNLEHTKSTKNTPDRINLAGGTAFKQSPELQLATLLLTSTLTEKYYESAESQEERLVNLLASVNPEFAAKAAIFARNEFGMRSVSHIAGAIITNTVKDEPWVKFAISDIVRRPDDMLEMVSYHHKLQGGTGKVRKIPNSMKKGLRLAFDKFDKYQIAKYRGERRGLKLVDLVRLIHAKGNSKNSEALSELIKGVLKSTDTFEAKLTKAGQKAKAEGLNEEETEELKAEAWKELVESKKIGQMALLRNLRNILETNDKDLIKNACDLLVDEKRIKSSMIFPYRYMVAYHQIASLPKASKILNAIEKAAKIALSNIPDLPGKTLVAVDCSGSMTTVMSQSPGDRIGNGVKLVDVGSLFAAAISAKGYEVDLVAFGSTAKYINMTKDTSLIEMGTELYQKAHRDVDVGHGTDIGSVYDLISKTGQQYDRVILISDMQTWIKGSAYGRYDNWKKEVAKGKVTVYCIDLTGYGTSDFPETKVMTIAGYSDKIFDVMKNFEVGAETLVDQINKVQLRSA